MFTSESAGLLAGFVFAHAAWSISDLPQGRLLVPLAGMENESERRFLRFEAETQELAVAEGKKYVAEQQPVLTAWAFARESLLKSNAGTRDALLIEVWARGMEGSLAFIQAFQPFASGQFKLLGAAVPVVDGVMLDGAESLPYLEVLHRGVASHGKAAGLWSSWQ